MTPGSIFSEPSVATPTSLKPIRFAANRGKKEGLYAGFTRGRGEVFVTIDSDSIIAPDALRHLVAPLLHDALDRGGGRQRQGL